ncbi:MAG: aminoacyl-tRNA hydrolase [Phycisphaerales bacterium]|nr:MAG: aminoacyl-tRNA hydrolase [Phycisphaerales bacterium]
MKLIVGLGNPGAEYEKTRHNAGFLVIDRLAERHARGQVARARFHALTFDANLPGAGKAMLMKPLTYMNRSGLAVGEAVRFFKIDPVADVFVIVDDIALPAGAIRIRAEGGPGGHNGLIDVQRALGTPAYARCRIGIDGPGRVPQADYVLGRFSPEQWAAVEPALVAAADASETWAREGVTGAMNAFNTKAPSKDAANGPQPRDGAATE